MYAGNIVTLQNIYLDQRTKIKIQNFLGWEDLVNIDIRTFKNLKGENVDKTSLMIVTSEVVIQNDFDVIGTEKM